MSISKDSRSTAARLLQLWVRIPSGAWMFVVSVVCCQVEVSATDWSLVQRSPTDRGASLCVIKERCTRGGYVPARGLQNTNPQLVVAPVEKINKDIFYAQKDTVTLDECRHESLIPCSFPQQLPLTEC
jgi:hypothetical protein